MSHDGHDHSHGHGDITAEKAEALLKYMLEHNEHHAEELHDLAHKLEHLGKQAAADAIEASLQAYRQGNAELEKAVKSL